MTINIGDIYGRWKVIEYAGNGQWICECQCDNHTIKTIKGYTLIKGTSKSCGCLRREVNSINKTDDFKGQQIGEWKVLEYCGSSKWKCQCSCGNIKLVKAQSLKSGKSKSCGHNTTAFKDIVGNKFGHWTVLEYCGNEMYKCACDCVNHTVKMVQRSNLVTGASKSCGCEHCKANLIDLTNMHFGKLTAKYYIGDGFWVCECNDCGDVSVHKDEHLRRNKSKFECRKCDRNINYEAEVNKVIEETTKELGRKPFRNELAANLCVGITTLNRYIAKFDLYDKLNNRYDSIAEMQLQSMFPYAEIHNRKALGNGKEIDIYIKDKQLGIEFNGGYWHSDIYKDKNYHQNKVISAEHAGIRLINIYEYEWNDAVYRNKLINYLKNIIDSNADIIYARNTNVELISSNEAIEFANKYHLQNGAYAEVNIGIKYNNELIGIMTFGKPRFNQEYQYEIIRLAFKNHIRVVGGTQKMLKLFINKYNPDSIISYCNIDKFTGHVYEELGMNYIGLTSPGYVWWNCRLGDKSSIYNRYSTTKAKLMKKGLGAYGSSEDEIMRTLGYYKIFNSGNKIYEWRK